MAELKTKATTPAAESSPTTYRTDVTRVRALIAAAVFLLAFGLYWITLAPTVTLIDSGELILAARGFGVAHPPGFPLYVLLANLFTRLPFGDIATRVHLASAFFAALSAAMMSLLAGEAVFRLSQASLAVRKQKSGRRKKGAPALSAEPAALDEPANLLWIALPSLFAGLLFGLSRTLWNYATIAEVYTLNTLLILTVFTLMFIWRRTKTEHAKANNRLLYGAALVFGLALGVHHVSVGLMLPALAALVLATEGWAFFKSKRLLYAALFAFLGLGVYLILPLAAARSPLMNWGDPRTFERFWWHVTARQYQVFFDPALSRISEFVRLALREFSYPWLPLTLILSAAGFVHLFRRDKPTGLFLSLVVVADVIYCLGYQIDEDKDAYYLPAFVAITIAAACGLRWLFLILRSARFRAVAVPASVTIAMLLPAVALASNLPYNNKSRYFIAHDYVMNILDSVEPGGMLLTNDWQVYSPMLYVRHLENRRGDVVVIDLNQLRRTWYFDYLRQVYPGVIEQSNDKVEAFLEDLRSWEQDPDAYARSAALSQRINTRYFDMILSFIANQLKTAPVYVTQDIALNRGGQNSELSEALLKTYKLMPRGLSFRVSDREILPEGEEEPLVTRGLNDGSLRFASDDVVVQKVYPVYLAMLTNRGRYLALYNQHEKAVERFRQALALDAGYEPAQRALAASQAVLKARTAQ